MIKEYYSRIDEAIAKDKTRSCRRIFALRFRDWLLLISLWHRALLLK